MGSAVPKGLSAMAAALLVGLALAAGAALGEERPGATAGESATAARASGGEVVREARKYIGKNFDYRNRRCRASAATIDGPCLTRVVYARFGVTLPDDVREQWKQGRRVAKADVRPGDALFFDTDGNGYLDTVGVYSGSGYFVHASGYFGEVVEKQVRNYRGYRGAKRMPVR